MTAIRFRSTANRPDQATALLVAALVDTLNETDPTFRARFRNRLARTFRAARNSASRDSLDMLNAVRAAVQDGPMRGDGTSNSS